MDAGYSCWDGWELTGKVRDTILRGSVLVEAGEFVGSKTARALRPAHTAPRGRERRLLVHLRGAAAGRGELTRAAERRPPAPLSPSAPGVGRGAPAHRGIRGHQCPRRPGARAAIR